MTREECKFIAIEGSNGIFWIRADQSFVEGGLTLSALLGFQLADKTSRQEAHQVADYMNQHIKGGLLLTIRSSRTTSLERTSYGK